MIHVICYGNYWQGDDGLGIHIYQKLMQAVLPWNVKVYEGGTAGWSTLGYFEQCDKAIIVDAVKSGGSVGTLHQLRVGDIDLPEIQLSDHGMGVNDLLTALPVALADQTMPEVVIIGAEVDQIQPFTCELSPDLQQAVDPIIDMIVRESVARTFA